MFQMVGRWARRLLPLMIVGGLLAAVAVLSMLGKPGLSSVSQKGKPPATIPTGIKTATLPPQPSANATRAVGTHPPKWLADLAVYGCIAVCAIVIIGLLYFLIKTLFSRQSSRQSAVFAPAGTISRRDAVLAAVDDSIAELAREDGDARAAVIACWVRLEEVAAVAGTAREPGDTSSDLVARLLGDHQVSANLLLSLADLYRTARYSSKHIESSMRDEARAALGRLRDELGNSRSGPLADEPVGDHATAGAPQSVRRPSPAPSRRPEARP